MHFRLGGFLGSRFNRRFQDHARLASVWNRLNCAFRRHNDGVRRDFGTAEFRLRNRNELLGFVRSTGHKLCLHELGREGFGCVKHRCWNCANRFRLELRTWLLELERRGSPIHLSHRCLGSRSREGRFLNCREYFAQLRVRFRRNLFRKICLLKMRFWRRALRSRFEHARENAAEGFFRSHRSHFTRGLGRRGERIGRGGGWGQLN